MYIYIHIYVNIRIWIHIDLEGAGGDGDGPRVVRGPGTSSMGTPVCCCSIGYCRAYGVLSGNTYSFGIPKGNSRFPHEIFSNSLAPKVRNAIWKELGKFVLGCAPTFLLSHREGHLWRVAKWCLSENCYTVSKRFILKWKSIELRILDLEGSVDFFHRDVNLRQSEGVLPNGLAKICEQNQAKTLLALSDGVFHFDRIQFESVVWGDLEIAFRILR